MNCLCVCYTVSHPGSFLLTKHAESVAAVAAGVAKSILLPAAMRLMLVVPWLTLLLRAPSPPYLPPGG